MVNIIHLNLSLLDYLSPALLKTVVTDVLAEIRERKITSSMPVILKFSNGSFAGTTVSKSEKNWVYRVDVKCELLLTDGKDLKPSV